MERRIAEEEEEEEGFYAVRRVSYKSNQWGHCQHHC